MSEVSTALCDPEELEKYQVEESPRVGFGDCNKEQEFEGEKKEAPAGGFRPGLVIRLTWTITASGILFPLFCQVLHLNERELPKDKCPSGILIVEFEQLPSRNFLTLIDQFNESLIFN